MRKIKFRLWDGKRMWYGTKEEWEKWNEWFEVKTNPINLLNSLLSGHYNAEFGDKDNKFVWMEYTGLKDKDGKEIYEGDIVRYSWLPKDHPQHKTGVVVIEDIRHIPPVLMKGWTFEIEVIGNVYENPDLLEEVRRMGDDKE